MTEAGSARGGSDITLEGKKACPLGRITGRMQLSGLPFIFRRSLGKEYSPYIDCGAVMGERWLR